MQTTIQITADQVLAALQQHRGKNAGIHVRALVQAITGRESNPAAQERRVRTLITELRLAGNEICGKPESGYFLAQNPAELEDTCKYLRSRAMSSLMQESRMRRMSLPELAGQLLLEPNFPKATTFNQEPL